MAIKRCPNCSSVKLLARKITGVQVESLDNGEFKINAEGSKYQLEIIGCAHCKSEFDESALIEMIPCKKCGTLTLPENLDENGECDVCGAIQARPDLANMSKEDLIRMMLKLEKGTVTNPAPTNIPVQPEVVQETIQPISSVAEDKMKAAQEAIKNASNDFSQEIVEEAQKDLDETQKRVEELQNAMDLPVEESTTEEKPKRGRPRKKDSADTATEEVTETQIENAVNEMSDFQEAPFPEQDAQMKEMFENTVQPENNVSYMNATVDTGATAQTPFQMFDEEQSF